MKYLRCKCGEATMWSSMGSHDCQGCSKCNTTFAEYPGGHKDLQPHIWGVQYDNNTGKPFKICIKCSYTDEKTYKLATQKDDTEPINVDEYYKDDLVIEIPPDDNIDEDGKIIDDPIKDELPIPKDLDEAIKVLTNDDNIKFVNESANEDSFLGQLHHGFGTGLRNGWGLWRGSVLKTWFNEIGIYHADDMSSIILTSLYRTVKNQEIKLDEQVKSYRDFWEKNNPDVNKGIV